MCQGCEERDKRIKELESLVMSMACRIYVWYERTYLKWVMSQKRREGKS